MRSDRAPFAITVIGGLSFSALLTLILIPTVCMGLENTLQWYKGAVRESMGSARFALYGRSRLYLVLWWWPPVAVRLWGVVVGRYRE